MKTTLSLKLLTLILLSFLCRPGYAQQEKPFCGTNDSLAEAYLQKISKQIDLTKARQKAGETLEYRLGVDVNYQTYLDYGGDKARIRKIVYDMFAETSGIFERETNIKLTVNFIYIWDQPEPYQLANDFDFFANVLDYWDKNRHEERDAVVSLSNRSGTFWGGYRMCSSNFPAPGYKINVDILAHELGHTLGSPHSHSCYWPGGPIDRCVQVEGPTETCPESYNEPINGSIMSYCRSKLTFHPLCRNLIRTYAEGEMNPSFKLKPFDAKPVAPGLLLVDNNTTQPTGPTPALEWYPSERTRQYRVQIARDEAFSQIVEDTLVNQSHLQSAGLNEGRYFARYQPQNDLGNAAWSVSAAFAVNAISETSPPPLLLRVARDNAGAFSGTFKSWPGMSSYQFKMDEIQFDREFDIQQPSQLGYQNFVIDLGDKRENEFFLRFRVKVNGVWSKWSDAEWRIRPLATIPLPSDGGKPLSASPVLAFKQWVSNLSRNPVSSSFEIATDRDFKNIVFRDQYFNGGLGEPYTDKVVFGPSLDEHTTYFSRSNVEMVENRKSAWSVYSFTTGVRDGRFQYLTTPTPGMRSTNFSMTYDMFIRFVNTGNALYVANFQLGYHKTTDLKTWESFIPSTTNGQSPMFVTHLGASPEGETLVANEQQSFTLKTNSGFKKLEAPINVGWQGTQAMLYTQKSGYFIRTTGRGIVQYHNGNWTAHQQIVPMGHAMCMAKDSQERIWAVGQEGYVWRYDDGQWSGQARFPLSDAINGMAFDKDDNCVVYGEFGAYRLAKSAQNWEKIEALGPFAIKKVVFDDDNNMWGACFRWSSDWSNPALEQYAIVKYANGKATAYSDGLNFLREQFDIEFFKGQLLIMTTGGEIHSFDEKQILSFVPNEAYCAGATATLSLATNSTFGEGNKIFVELRNTENSKTVTWEVAQPGTQGIGITLPDTLANGRYAVALRTTNPEIRSNESAAFEIISPPVVQVPAVERNGSQVILKTDIKEGYTYQWLLNGSAIAGATGATISAAAEGEYAVTVTNRGGCAVTSESVSIEMDKPQDYILMQNTPNPAITFTNISFYVPEATDVKLTLYNSAGQKLADLYSGPANAGWHIAKVPAEKLPHGVYVYKLKAGTFTQSLKMVR